MATSENKISRQVEYLILGSDLSAQLIAESLHQQGASVQIAEERAQLGGLSVPLLGQRGQLPPHLDFLPDQETTRQQLTWLDNLLQKNLSAISQDLPPLTFDEGQLRTFVGFGARKCQSLDEITPYTNSQHLNLAQNLSQCTQELISRRRLNMCTGKVVTQLQLQEGRIVSVEFNGNEICHPKTVITTFSPKRLLALMPEGTVDSKTRSRIDKSFLWNSVSLHLHHRQTLQPQTNVHVLSGGGDEHEPLIGKFMTPLENGSQHSVWLSFVAPEHDEDHDYAGQVLKHMKRQIKRAYPEAFTDLIDEKLVISPYEHGHVSLKAKNAWNWPEIENLVVAHSSFSVLRGPAAQLDMAYQVANSFSN